MEKMQDSRYKIQEDSDPGLNFESLNATMRRCCSACPSGDRREDFDIIEEPYVQ